MNEAIRLAIGEGGWLPEGYDPFIKRPRAAFIDGERIVLQGTPADGWDGGESFVKLSGWNTHWNKQKTLLDTAFWKALGKALWEETDMTSMRYDPNHDEWRYQWHRFIDHIAEGKDADDFFKALLAGRKVA